MNLNKAETLWVVVNKDGLVLYDTFSYARKESIKYFLNTLQEKDWTYWRKNYGYDCIKVSVLVTPKH